MKAAIVLHSSLDPVALADTLRRSIDEKRRTIFSLSGYRGALPVLGKISNHSFELQKRRYWRNDFAPRFYAEFHPEARGTRIEGRFDMTLSVKWFMWIWLGIASLIGLPLFISAVRDVLFNTHTLSGDIRIALIVPPALILWGFVLSRLGRLLGRGEEQYLLDFVQQTLAAQVDPACCHLT